MGPGLPTVLRSLAALDRSFEHDPAELRARAEDLLSRPPYTEAEPGLTARLLEWLGDAVARIVQAVTDGIAATGPAGAWVVVVLGSVVLGIVVWRLTRGATLDRRTPEVPTSTPPRSAASWREEARQHETAGRRRDAVRCWYAALVVHLAERGVVEDVPGRTVRELDEELARTAPALLPAVRAAGERFEAVVYGGHPASDEAVEVVRRAARELDEVPA